MAGPDVETFAGWLDEAERVLFITGAGLSADSGLPTYRGIGGLYDKDLTDDGVPIEVALSGPMFRRNPALTWKYIAQIERACRGAAPNGAHRFIADWAQGHDAWVLTQNVDGLHRAAGSTKIVEIHGNIHHLRCTDCDWKGQVEDYAAMTIPPRCERCEAVVRPEVVLFGEMLPPAELRLLDEACARPFDLVVSIGTTSVFPYIAEPVLTARRRGKRTVEINPGETEVSRLVGLRLRLGAAEVFRRVGEILG